MTFFSLQAMDSTRFLKYSPIAILVVHSSVMFPLPVHHVHRWHWSRSAASSSKTTCSRWGSGQVNCRATLWAGCGTVIEPLGHNYGFAPRSPILRKCVISCWCMKNSSLSSSSYSGQKPETTSCGIRNVFILLIYLQRTISLETFVCVCTSALLEKEKKFSRSFMWLGFPDYLLPFGQGFQFIFLFSRYCFR